MKIKALVYLTFLLAFSTQAHDWELVYENDASGNKVTGEYQDLVDQLKAGASIRIYVPDYKMMLNPRLCKISSDNSYVVCQTAFHGANDKQLFDNHEINNFTSSGERIARSYQMNGTFLGSATYNVGIQWYVHP